MKLIEYWPGGISSVLISPDADPKTERTLQKPLLPDDPATCVFVNIPQKDLADYRPSPGWRVIENKNKRLPLLVMAIPELCMDIPAIRGLGAARGIEGALATVSDIVAKEPGEIRFGIHIGYAAGQTVPHLHWHVARLPKTGISKSISPEEIKQFIRETPPNRFFSDAGSIVSIVGGFRTGMVYFAPKKEIALETAIGDLAAIIDGVVSRFNEKFKSREGLPPDYSLGFSVDSSKRFVYGYYMPILNYWGLSEYMGIQEGTPLSLAWSHDKTAAYLR